ncbi:hypothetical protein MC885_000918, partial [Smutsia gigantea]
MPVSCPGTHRRPGPARRPRASSAFALKRLRARACPSRTGSGPRGQRDNGGTRTDFPEAMPRAAAGGKLRPGSRSRAGHARGSQTGRPPQPPALLGGQRPGGGETSTGETEAGTHRDSETEQRTRARASASRSPPMTPTSIRLGRSPRPAPGFLPTPARPHRLPGRTHVDRVDVGFVEEAECPAQLQGRGDAVIPGLQLQVPVSGAEGKEVLAAQAAPGSRQQQLQEQRPRPLSPAPADRAQHVPKLTPANPVARRPEAEKGGDVTGRPPRPLQAARLPLLPPGERGGTEWGGREARPVQGAPRRLPNGREGEGGGDSGPRLRPRPRRPRLPRVGGAGGCGSRIPSGPPPLGPREAGAERGALHPRPGSGAVRVGAGAAPIPGRRPPSAAWRDQRSASRAQTGRLSGLNGSPMSRRTAAVSWGTVHRYGRVGGATTLLALMMEMEGTFPV